MGGFLKQEKRKEKGKRKKLGGTRGKQKGRIVGFDSFFFFSRVDLSKCFTQVRI